MENEITFRRLVYDIIADILESKEGSVHPCMAHISEIRNSLNVELMEVLRNLWRDGIVEHHIDLNKNPMFTIKKTIEQ